MAAPNNITPINITDDLGFRLELKSHPHRIISLVPSWTETLFAMGLGNEVVGVTKFCVEPADGIPAVEKIGGTKNPDLRAIAKLEPDFVIANAEENRREDVEKIREQGVPVFTTYPKTIPGAVESILKLGAALGKESDANLMAREIVRNVSGIEASVGVLVEAAVPGLLPDLEKSLDGFQCRYLRARCAAHARLQQHFRIRGRALSDHHAGRGDRGKPTSCCCRTSRMNSRIATSRS